MMMIKESCELHTTGHMYRDIPPNEQNDLSPGLLRSSSDDESNSDLRYVCSSDVFPADHPQAYRMKPLTRTKVNRLQLILCKE